MAQAGIFVVPPFAQLATSIRTSVSPDRVGPSPPPVRSRAAPILVSSRFVTNVPIFETAREPENACSTPDPQRSGAPRRRSRLAPFAQPQGQPLPSRQCGLARLERRIWRLADCGDAILLSSSLAAAKDPPLRRRAAETDFGLMNVGPRAGSGFRQPTTASHQTEFSLVQAF